MSFRRCKGTAISAPPQSHHWGILYTINMVLTQIPPPQIRLALRFRLRRKHSEKRKRRITDLIRK